MDNRVYMYHADHGAKIFDSPEVVPDGWCDSPPKPVDTQKGDVEVGALEGDKPKRKYKRKKG